MARAQKNAQPLTTAQRLASIVKSCRDIMRKDKGLNGDLDRLPMLTWIMFLKFLDDMERCRAGARWPAALSPGARSAVSLARLGGEEDGITGRRADPFVNNEEAVRPMARKARDCSPICAACRAPTAATGAMLSPRCSKARSTG